MDIRRMFTYDYNSNLENDSCPTNEIWYTSSDGNVVTPYSTTVFGANIVSNNYVNGSGIISFDGPITSIGKRAFRQCTSLTSVTIPDSVTTIGAEAFAGCSSLTSMTIPESLTSIGYDAFGNCNSLKEFKGKFAADNGRCLIIDGVLNSFARGCGVTGYTIPNSVTKIGDYAFNHFYSLTSVTIPNSVTKIGDWAFNFCKSLTSVNIPDSVTTIGKSTFTGCNSLTSVTIGDSVTNIGNTVFSSCNSLTSVYCKATTPPSLGGTSVFDYNASDRRIYVPTGSVDAYKSATRWSEYASAIVGYDF